MFLYITTEQSKNENKKAVAFIIEYKSITYNRINLAKDIKDLYTENCKILLLIIIIKKTQTNGKASYFHVQKNLRALTYQGYPK